MLTGMDAFGPPVPVGARTVTNAEPTAAMSAGVTCAFSSVAEINVVVRAEPFHCTTEELANPDPATSSVNAGPPAAANVGDNDVSTAGLMVNVIPPEVAPPGLLTVTGTVPLVATSPAATCIVN